MNLYITVEDRSKLKKAFFNLRKQQIVVAEEVAAELGYSIDQVDAYSSFIVNERIKKIISSTASGKKMQSIIYVNDKLNDEIARELIHFCQESTKVDKIILLTEKNKHEDIYELFEEILFFPSLKKVHIIECTTVPVVWSSDENINEFLDPQ
jgi:Tfp pilus assembly PilM family ATPase